MIESTVQVFTANDGKQFNSREDCLNYERFLTISCEEVQNYIQNFLDNNGGDYEVHNVTHKVSFYSKVPEFGIEMGWKGSKYQLDEDFDFDMGDWDDFQFSFLKHWKFNFDMPSGYWGK